MSRVSTAERLATQVLRRERKREAQLSAMLGVLRAEYVTAQTTEEKKRIGAAVNVMLLVVESAEARVMYAENDVSAFAEERYREQMGGEA